MASIKFPQFDLPLGITGSSAMDDESPAGLILAEEYFGEPLVAPLITVEPTNQSGYVGGTATFTATVTGNPAPTFQWQYLSSAGSSSPVLLSVENVTLPGTADSGNVNVTAPAGANAMVVGGTFFVSDSSLPTSLTGSQLSSATITGITGAGTWMSAYAGYAKVNAVGAQTIRIQKTGNYTEGPTCQIFWLTVPNPDDFVRQLSFATPNTGSLTTSVNSTTGDLVLGCFGKDSNNSLSTPSGCTQQGTTQTNNLDSSLAFSVNSPGATTTSVTTASISYPSLFLISLKAGTTETWTDVADGTGGTTNSYTTPTLISGLNGRQYRLVATNSKGTDTSVTVTLTVTDGLLTYRSESTGGIETANTTAVVLAPTMQAGDLDIIIIGAGVIGGPSPSINTPSGWTKITEVSSLPLAGVVSTTLAVYYRIATGSGSSVTFTASAASLWGWSRMVYDEPNAIPIGQVVLGHLPSSTNPVLPSITTSKTNSLRIDWMSQALAQGATPPASMTGRINDEAGGIAAADQQISTIQSTGTRTWTIPASADLVYAVIELHSVSSVSGGSPSRLKRWNGSSWESVSVKYWNGSTWSIKPLKRWNGSSWVNT